MAIPALILLMYRPDSMNSKTGKIAACTSSRCAGSSIATCAAGNRFAIPPIQHRTPAPKNLGAWASAPHTTSIAPA